MKTKKGHSQTYEIWRRLKKNKTAVAALIFICILVILAIFADVIADYKTVVIKTMYPSVFSLLPKSTGSAPTAMGVMFLPGSFTEQGPRCRSVSLRP